MFVLDTHVVSELRKAKSGKADGRVIAWMGTVATDQIFLSAITVMEIDIGIQRVERRDPAQGQRLRVWLDEQVLPAFVGRILAVDLAVARQCAAFMCPKPVPSATR